MATASLNPNAPVYYPSPLLYHPTTLELYNPPSSFYSSQPLLLLPNPSFHEQQQQQQQQQQPFYFEYHQTPSHTSLLYASSPPPPQPFYYYHPLPQTLYSCYYHHHHHHFTSPPLPFPGQRAIIEEFKDTDQTTAGDNPTTNTAAEDVRVRTYGCFGRRKIFAPRPKARRKPSSAPPPHLLHSSLPLLQKRRACAEFEFGCNEENKTTVMIKNLPNKFTKEKLICILDQHCLEENQKSRYLKRGEDCEGSQENVSSEFDFFYLPIDFRSGSNLGYAFVNFTTHAAAWRLHRFLHNYEWKLHGSRKVCEVTYARIQGLEALLKHFKNSVFICGYDEFLPVSFDPPRDGVRRPEQQFIGKRLPPTSPPPAGLKGRRKGEE